MSETRKIAAILVADIVGYSRLAGTDEDRTLARLRALRSDLIDPTIAVHHGRIVKRTGDGSLIEFRSVVDAVRCAIEVQRGLDERNAGLPQDRRIEFRVGIHLGDVVEEADGDLMGDGVNIAARLESICEPGAICLSEDAYRQVKARLDLAVTDLGPTQLKNIAEPIRVYSLKIGQPARAKPVPAPAPEKSAPPRLSIVVLPFANIGGDPEQEYFVDGVTESLTTDLSRIRGSFVIGRNTAFTYKGKAVDLKQIGRELDVRYVLEGSVQRSGERMRVNVQLVEAESGAHLWAERFDKPLADLFDMQDEIVARLARALDAQLVAAEARRAERAPTPDSTDLYFQGMACVNKGPTPENMEAARGYFERALMLDRANIEALAGMAFVETAAATVLMREDRSAHVGAAETMLARVLSRAPEHAFAHQTLGILQIHTHRVAEGVGELEQALALDRNLASAHGFIGLAKIFMGRGEETEAHIQEALRLSPHDTFAHVWIAFAGIADLYLGKEEEAAARLRRATGMNQNFSIAHFCLASALARLGRLLEARGAIEAGLMVDPRFSLSHFRTTTPSDNPVYLAQHERLCEGMRLAGAPE
jgi:TolB-like protein/class 3 adenylate cyclase